MAGTSAGRAGRSGAAVLTLSGGNQQKVILARWLRCGSEMFVLEEPTAGVDMGSKHAIYERLTPPRQAAPECRFRLPTRRRLCAICDRVLVMRKGTVGTVSRATP